MARTAIIWDRTTRLLHWMIAVIILLNLFVLEHGDPPHRWLGIVAVGLVSIRGFWGLAGGEHSRFRTWPLRPHQIKDFFRDQSTAYAGHNPPASLVYILIWLTIVALGVTGWMTRLDRFWGEEWLEEIHGGIAIWLQALIVVHCLGMALDARKHRRRTWMAMISGRRE
jgi:cytochrome b